MAGIRASILSGEFPPGSLHSIYGLAASYGVSRTPVREAVVRLADTGMVSIEKNHGVRIVGVTVADVIALFELRLLLEVPGARFAAANRDDKTLQAIDEHLAGMSAAIGNSDAETFLKHDYELHEAVLAVSGNARLMAVVRGLRDATQVMGASTINESRGLREIQAEHEPVVDAIRRKDPDAAAHAMRSHLIRTGRLLARQVAASGGGGYVDGWPEEGVAAALSG